MLHDGDQVSDQTTIVTDPGAGVILVFSNGATVDISGDSRLDIDEFEQDPFSVDLKASDLKQEPATSVTKLSMTKGELVGRIAHLNVDRGSEFTVRNPVGAAGIRGTFFRHLFRPGKDHKAHLSLETFEGLIVFTGLATGPVSIGAGHKFEATLEYDPKDPDNPWDWLPPASLTLEGLFISPLEGAQFQSDLQAILAALDGVVFHPVGPGSAGIKAGGQSGGTTGAGYQGDTSAPPPVPPLNPPTPGAGSGP